MSAATMSRRQLLASLCAGAVAAACTSDPLGQDSPAERVANRRQRLLDESARTGVNQGLVSLALLREDPSLRLAAIAGQRDLSSRSAATLSDVYRIGSCSKTMTCVLAATLVEQGVLTWDAPLLKVLPQFAATTRADYQSVTLEQLLNHQAGVLAFNDYTDVALFAAYLGAQTDPLPTTFEGRQDYFAQWLLTQPPPDGVTPGKTFYYSNAGYVLAAMMMSRAAAMDFLTLFDLYVSRPLGGRVWLGSRAPGSAVVTTGYQGAQGALEAPPAIPAELEPWNEVLNQPAGGVHTTPEGYSIWLQALSGALRGSDARLPMAYVEKLKAATTGDYVLGWETLTFGGRDVLAHTGIVSGYTCLAIVDRTGQSAAAALTNTQSPDAGPDWVVTAMLEAVSRVDAAW
jgi:D-alanyl-D-alanine carboxypeptidase